MACFLEYNKRHICKQIADALLFLLRCALSPPRTARILRASEKSDSFGKYSSQLREGDEGVAPLRFSCGCGHEQGAIAPSCRHEYEHAHNAACSHGDAFTPPRRKLSLAKGLHEHIALNKGVFLGGATGGLASLLNAPTKKTGPMSMLKKRFAGATSARANRRALFS